MRFAWIREKSSNSVSIKQGYFHPLAIIRMVYNIVFWIFLLPFFAVINYDTGFVVFTVIIFIRLIANLYTNNIMEQKAEIYEKSPLRIPS